jgi:hypothetical protein
MGGRRNPRPRRQPSGREVMDDLELALKCAQVSEAWKDAHKLYPTMTLDPTFAGAEIRGKHCYLLPNNPMRQDPQVYDPLHDDAQAMALVKKFHLETRWYEDESAWGVFAGNEKVGCYQYKDLNRAICECVARLSNQ